MRYLNSSFRPVYLAAVLGVASVLPFMASAEATAKLTEEPTHGSIQVTQSMGKADLAKLATLTQAEASAAATAHSPGKIIEAELTTENGFLVWEVKSLTEQGVESELYIDAGNGEVLAMEQEASDKDDHD